MRPREKNILSSHLLRRSKRQRLQELLLALKTALARPSPQPLNFIYVNPTRVKGVWVPLYFSYTYGEVIKDSGKYHAGEIHSTQAKNRDRSGLLV